VRNHRWSTFILLFALFASGAARAQTVTVFDFFADKKGKVRFELVNAMDESKQFEFVSLRRWRDTGFALGIPWKKAALPEHITRVAPKLDVQGVLMGAVVGGKTLKLRLVDGRNKQLWKSQVKLVRGKLTPAQIEGLISEISAALGGSPAAPPAVAAREPPPLPTGKLPAGQAPSKAPPAQASGGAEPTAPALDLTAEAPATASEPTAVADSGPGEVRSTVAPSSEPDDPYFSTEGEVRKSGGGRSGRKDYGPSFVSFQLSGLTVWRGYCSRPGVASCRDYERMEQSVRPPGNIVTFASSTPYFGFALAADFFPLANSGGALQGLGLVGSYQRGFTRTIVNLTTSTGEDTQREVISSDDGFLVAATYRYYLVLGPPILGSQPLGLSFGAKAGYSARNFEVDPTAQTPLPGSHRSYPLAGVDVELALARALKLGVSVHYFMNPKPNATDLAGFGTAGSGRGLGIEGGLSGDLWGPVGYVLRVRSATYKDQFTGIGAREQWGNGGAVEESYTSVNWGLSASF
jgi:hypothetical protein